jgi:Polysaccharide deacetylase
MNELTHKIGYFVFSLDTELAWGTLDWNQGRSQHTSRNGLTERKTIHRLLDLMDEFGVSATWAITGHLFYDKCEECAVCPVMDLKGKDSSFEQIWKTQDPMWYGSDIVDLLLSRSDSHEIAFHGYTHKRFRELSTDEARFEIQEWLRLAKRKNIVPKTAIFPQGNIGHLDLFREAGFICYRGNDVPHPMFSIPLFGKVVKRTNLLLSILTPQVYDIQFKPQGLVNLPSSQWFFRIDRRIEKSLDWVNLHRLRFYGTVNGLEKAAQERKIIHLWAHPHEFRTEKDFEKLRFVFGHFAKHAKEGRLQSITMADLATQALRTSGRGSTHPEESICSCQA